MTSVSSKVLDTIQRHKLRPRPRWHFTMQNALLLSGVGLAVLLMSLIAGLLLVGAAAGQEGFTAAAECTLTSAPLIFFTAMLSWVLLFGVCIFLLRRTKQGHRFPFSHLIAVVLLLNGFLSGVLNSQEFIPSGSQLLALEPCPSPENIS